MAKGFIRLQFDERRIMADIANIMVSGKTAEKRALTKIAQNIMAQSQAEVPRETNTLGDSGYIKAPVETPTGVEIELGYGGPKDKRNPSSGQMASEYALYQHETPGTPPGGGNYHPYGKWKYLEDPINQHQVDFAETVSAELRVAWSPGIGGK